MHRWVSRPRTGNPPTVHVVADGPPRSKSTSVVILFTSCVFRNSPQDRSWTGEMAAAAVVAQQYGRPPPRLLVATLMPIALLLILQPLMPALLPDAVVRQFGVALPKQPTYPALQVNLGFGILAFVGAVQIIPVVSESFSEKGLQGRDLLKPGGRTSGPWV